MDFYEISRDFYRCFLDFDGFVRDFSFFLFLAERTKIFGVIYPLIILAAKGLFSFFPLFVLFSLHLPTSFFFLSKSSCLFCKYLKTDSLAFQGISSSFTVPKG